MSPIQLIVTLFGVVLSGFIAWFFWFAPKGQTRAAVEMGGAQEVAPQQPGLVVDELGQRLERHAELVLADNAVEILETGGLALKAEMAQESIGGVPGCRHWSLSAWRHRSVPPSTAR